MKHIREKELFRLRKEYKLGKLDEASVNPDPVIQFERWFTEAVNAGIDDVNAMILATADRFCVPSARTVLLKDFGKNGFSFFTNYGSKKGSDLNENPNAALVFYWKELERQVRIRGKVKKLPKKVSAGYFAVRPLKSQLAAWSSPQSSKIEGREYLEERFNSYEKEFEKKKMQLPPFWGGYILVPFEIEFWQGRENRLHDRILFDKVKSRWKISRLAP